MKKLLSSKVKWLFVIISSCLLIICIYNNVYAEGKKYYDGEIDIIAYSVVGGIEDAPINSAEHFLHCCSDEYPFTTLKGDLRLTADNGIVMCHDKGFTFNSEGRITSYKASNSVNIHDLTLDQCLGLVYAKKYNDEDVNVCDFETYIKICSENDKRAYITIRDEYIPELIDVMMPIIYKYNMQSKCIINSFTLESLKEVKKYDSTIELSWVMSEGKLSKERIDTAHELGNCLITLFNFPTDAHGGFMSLDDYGELFDYAYEKNVKLYAAIVESVSYLDELRGYGISGAQMSSLNEIELPPLYSRKIFRKIIKRVHR